MVEYLREKRPLSGEPARRPRRWRPASTASLNNSARGAWGTQGRCEALEMRDARQRKSPAFRERPCWESKAKPSKRCCELEAGCRGGKHEAGEGARHGVRWRDSREGGWEMRRLRKRPQEERGGRVSVQGGASQADTAARAEAPRCKCVCPVKRAARQPTWPEPRRRGDASR